MSDKNINQMDFKELRNEVQLLRDDIAKWKRAYEDILYNLDTENFSDRLVKERNGMKTAIEITAEGLKSTVSAEDLETKLSSYSTFEQTAEAILSTVSRKYTKTSDLETKLSSYSTFEQTAEAISSVVSKTVNLENAIEVEDYEKLCAQNGTDKSGAPIDIKSIYKICNHGTDEVINGETYYYYDSLNQNWEILCGNNLYTVFEQTEEGFRLKGDVIVEGVANVANTLYLGGKSNENQNASLYFNKSANISTYDSIGFNSQNALKISASELDLSLIDSINWGKNAPVAVFG